MWTTENRGRYNRSKLRYPSDLTDEEWKLVEPLIPPGKRGGGKRTVIMREVVNGLMYILSTGCQWSAIPKDLPPKSTVSDYFDLWSWDGTLNRVHEVLYVECRERARPAPPPRSSTARASKALKKGGLRSAWIRCRQEDQRQETSHSRRYARLADARHRACRRSAGSRWRGPCHGDPVRSVSVPVEALCRWRLSGPDIPASPEEDHVAREHRDRFKRSDTAKKFVVLPKRWIVERTFAWLGRCRRLARDWENFNQKALAFLRLASIRLMLRKLCNPA